MVVVFAILSSMSQTFIKGEKRSESLQLHFLSKAIHQSAKRCLQTTSSMTGIFLRKSKVAIEKQQGPKCKVYYTQAILCTISFKIEKTDPPKHTHKRQLEVDFFSPPRLRTASLTRIDASVTGSVEQ